MNNLPPVLVESNTHDKVVVAIEWDKIIRTKESHLAIAVASMEAIPFQRHIRSPGARVSFHIAVSMLVDPRNKNNKKQRGISSSHGEKIETTSPLKIRKPHLANKDRVTLFLYLYTVQFAI